MPAIHWDYFDKPGSPLRIKGTAREDPAVVLIHAILLHEDFRGIDNYDFQEYDNDADAEYVADKQAWIEAGGVMGEYSEGILAVQQTSDPMIADAIRT